MYDEQTNEIVVRERVEKRLRRVKYLIIHLILTFIIVAIAVLATEEFGLSNDVGQAVAVGAALTWVAHILRASYQEAAHTIIQQEIQQQETEIIEQERQYANEKAKNESRRYTLSDDGELVEIFDDDDEAKVANQG